MFRHVPVFEHDSQLLIDLGETMIQPFEEDEERSEAAASEDRVLALDKPLQEEEDEDENHERLAGGALRLPAGYTYFGQFVDHDITFDPASSLTRQNDPNALTDFRTPRFDLDSLYGAGPANQPYLYKAESDGSRLRLLLGPDETDLQRNVAESRALIGDPRNDENVIVSQLQVAFIKFHNAVVDRWEAFGFTGDDLFKQAQQTVRWHYQWVVIHDFLPRLVGDAVRDAEGRPVANRVVDSILRGETYQSATLGDGRATHTLVRPQLHFFEWHVQPFMPVEFSVAAYRFGHSMARPSYLINDTVDGPGRVVVRDRGQSREIRVNRIPLFPLTRRTPRTRVGGPVYGLSGFGAPRSDMRVQWKYLLDDIEGEPDGDNDELLPQPSYKIDTALGHPLGALPDNVAKAESLFGARPRQAQSLAVRNLLRGRALGIPSGQAVAKAMGIDPLTIEPPPSADARASEEEKKRIETLRRLFAPKSDLRNNTPLWYYVLKEAQLNEGHHLGPVGGRIVAEVLIGLLCGDPLSYLSAQPTWQPFLGPVDGRFTLSDLVNYSRQAKPLFKRR
jgi:hypothetical protein